MHTQRLVGWLSPSTVDAEVPDGEVVLEKMRQCAEVLMTPDTSFDASHDPHSRPEHEVDLSSLGPPLRHGKVLLITSLHARAAMRANGAAPLA